MQRPNDLGRSDRAQRMARRLSTHLADKSATCTFAIVGPWGSGKTWLLEKIVTELKDGENAVREGDLVRFNPWFYADESALFVGFAELLLDLTSRENRARKKMARVLATVGPSLKFGDVDLSSLARVGEEWARGLSGPEQIRTRVSKSVKEARRHVLIVMDDLDRLSPSELLMLFKLIRLVGDVPGISYLLTYDEETLLQLLARTDIAADSEERARRYLEKIVEVKWVVPPLTTEQVEELLHHPISQIVTDASSYSDGLHVQDSAIEYRVASMLRKRITTPRAAERFVAMFRELPARALAELDFDDLVFAFYLRAYAPRVWTVVVEEHELLTGGGVSGYRHRESVTAQLLRLRERIVGILEDDPGDTDELIELIQDHFPRFDNAIRGRNDHHGDRPLRISEPEFVARYMWLDLPPGSVSELEVRRQIAGLPIEAAADWLRSEVTREPVLALESMLRAVQAEPSHAQQAFDFLAALYRKHKVPGLVDPFVGLDGRIRVNARILLSLMTPDEVDAVLAGYLRSAALVRSLITRELRASSYSEQVHEKLRAAALRLATELEQHLPEGPSPAWGQDEARRDLLDLLRIDGVRAASLAKKMIDSLAWRADDVATLYVTGALALDRGHGVGSVMPLPRA